MIVLPSGMGLVRPGTSAPLPFTPGILSGLTYAFSAYTSSMYKGASTTAGAATANGDAVIRIDSDNSIGYTLWDATPTPAPVLVAPAFGTGLNGVNSAGVNRIPVSYVKPVGTASPSTQAPVSTFIANNESLFIWAGVINAAPTAAGNIYDNPGMVNDVGLFTGLHYNDNGGGNTRFIMYNYDGTADSATTTAPTGVPIVIVGQHTGGNIRLAKNGVTWGGSVASGNTTTLTSVLAMNLGKTGSDITTGSLVVCNASNSDANILIVVKQMGSLVGLSL